jgi:hypothetical protein
MFQFSRITHILSRLTQNNRIGLLKKCSRFSILVVIGVMLSSLHGTSAFAVNNKPPVISNFRAEQGPEDFWTFSGTVTDVDDYVEGMTVYFGGVLAGYGYTATVYADGTFYMTHEIPDLQSGIATAQTYDWSLNPSNLAMCYVFAYD